MKRLHAWQSSWPLSTGGRLAILLALIVLNGLGTALASQWITTHSVTATLQFCTQSWFWLTTLFLLLLTGVITLVTRSVFVGSAFVMVISLVLTLINYYKVLIASTPLKVADFKMAGRLGAIANLNAEALPISWVMITCGVLAVVWLCVVFVLSGGVRLHWKVSLGGAGCFLVAFVLLFVVGGNPLIYAPRDLGVDKRMPQSSVNGHTGVLLGLWRDALVTVANSKKAGATPEELQELVQQVDTMVDGQETPAVKEQPNVILILSESFFDVTTLPGVTYEEDPLAEYHALQQEGVSGTFHTRTVGYGTCNIELEILTGINTALLAGEDLYSMDAQVFSSLPSLPAIFGANGYYTASLHTYNDTTYNRTPMFQAADFQDIFFSDGFAYMDPEAAAAGDNYWGYMSTKLSGRFYSDAYLSDVLIDLYEKKTDEAPMFLYGISVENHSPYDGEKYVGEDLTVAMTSPLTGEAAQTLLTYSQGANNASEALGALTDYFSQQEEPTIIVFFGDHRPGFGVTDGGTVYSQLGMCADNLIDWTAEEKLELYSTDYLIWSNDADYLPAQPGTRMDTSSNYLGVEILNMAGVEKPLYWQFLQYLSQARMIDTWDYSLSRDGVYGEASQEDEANLSIMGKILDDTIYGNGIITQEMWAPYSATD